MSVSLNRRQFLWAGAGTLAGAALSTPSRVLASSNNDRNRIYKAVVFNRVQTDAPIPQKFELLGDVGFSGAEIRAPFSASKQRALTRAQDSTDVRAHGVMNKHHWQVRLSDPDPKVREQAVEYLKISIRDAAAIGASSVLLVPGKVTDPEHENYQQVWNRSIEGIRKAIPLAADRGVYILVENVWNNFFYDPQGGRHQQPDDFVRYIDEIASPWVAAYFDIGNFRRYAKPSEWIRALGHRIVKLHVKDWGRGEGFVKIGEGDVNWADIRAALKDIRFSGWATAEVDGGGRERLAEIASRMDKVLGL